MKRTIFYIWQSDITPSANRNFILRALEEAAKSLQTDDTLNVEPVVDRDTSGVPGSPDIAATIFEKIDASDVVVADVSIINMGQPGRPTPNPNVLVELGYALKAKGKQRTVLVFNTAFGKVEDLPFDLRGRRITTYHMPADTTDRSVECKNLQRALQDAIRAILPVVQHRPPSVQIYGSGSEPGPIMFPLGGASVEPGVTVLSRRVTVVNKTLLPVNVTAKRLIIDASDWPVRSITFQDVNTRAKGPTITVVGNSHIDYLLHVLIPDGFAPAGRIGILEFQIDDEEMLHLKAEFRAN